MKLNKLSKFYHFIYLTSLKFKKLSFSLIKHYLYIGGKFGKNLPKRGITWKKIKNCYFLTKYQSSDIKYNCFKTDINYFKTVNTDYQLTKYFLTALWEAGNDRRNFISCLFSAITCSIIHNWFVLQVKKLVCSSVKWFFLFNFVHGFNI